VDEVEPAGGAPGFGAQQSGAEGAHLRGQILLREFLEGPGSQVGNAHSRLDLQRRWHGGRHRTREDLDLDARGGESTRCLEDIDIEAARVTGAGLIEGRRVE